MRTLALWECVVGNAMSAVRKLAGKSNVEMFDDVPVLQRKWQAALRPGEKLPRYEDVMLGSLGRLADHIALLKHNHETLEVSRTGRYVQKWLGDDRWDIPLAALPPDCATALGEAAASALANNRPYLAAAHCVRNGMVQTYDILALPTSSRWGGTLIGVYVNERATQYNLRMRFFPPPTRAYCRWRRSAIAAACRSISRSFITTRAPRACSRCRPPA
jgi:hypothetical protein